MQRTNERNDSMKVEYITKKINERMKRKRIRKKIEKKKKNVFVH